MTTTTKNKIHTIIILALMFGFRFLPTFSTVTPFGMKILGIFLGCIYAWTVGWNIWPSMLALIAIGLTGYNSVSGMFTSAYGNATLHLVWFSLLFCYAIEQSGLLVFVANWILKRKFIQKGPWMLCFAFWLTACIGGFITANALPVVILLWTLFYEVAQKIGIKPYDKFGTIVLVGITVTAYLGNVTAPYCPFCQIIFGAAIATAPDFTVNYMSYMLLMIVLDVVSIPVLVLLFKYIFRPKTDFDFTKVNFENNESSLTPQQKIVLVSVIVLCLSMVLPNLMPKTWAITILLTQIGTNGIFAGMCVVLALLTYDGKPLLDLGKAMSFGVPWRLWFLVATALAMSSAIVAPGTGINELLVSVLKPILDGTSPFVFCLLIMLMGMVLTNIINNVVCATILIPIVITFASMVGASSIVIVSLLVLVLMMGLVLPSGSVLGALLHGNKEWITTKDIYVYASFACLIIAVICAVVGYPVGSMLF